MNVTLMRINELSSHMGEKSEYACPQIEKTVTLGLSIVRSVSGSDFSGMEQSQCFRTNARRFG